MEPEKAAEPQPTKKEQQITNIINNNNINNYIINDPKAVAVLMGDNQKPAANRRPSN